MDPLPRPADVRMRGFSQRTPVDRALEWIDRSTGPNPRELVGLEHAAGRVLAEDAVSPIDVPRFERAMMDGYALRAEETSAASEDNPLRLAVIGEAFPARPFGGTVQAGQVVRIMTGAPMPSGADAVLPAERVEVDSGGVRVFATISSGKHVGRVGEDVRRGATVLTAMRRLRPQDVGLLSSIGIGQVPVVRRPRVRILVTGDELLPAGSAPSGYRIADANGPMLAALARRDGADVIECRMVADRPDDLLAALRQDADVVLVSGGSSVGQEDHAPRLVAEHGELAVHGVAMRPSSPTGMGRLAGQLVFLLPGNPVSCLCAYDFFAGRAIRRLGGRSPDWPYRRQRMRLADKLVSQVGRVDYVRVRIERNEAVPIVSSGASNLSSTTLADGFVVVPPQSEGYAAGSEVDVHLYD